MAQGLAGRLLTLFRRRRRAKRLGIDFRRAASWQLPKSLVINGERWQVTAPRDNGTKGAFLDIFLDDCYGIESVDQQVRTVLDIGAHAGFFSMHARNTYPDALIHAYEPNPQMTPILEHQARAARFIVYPEAVGNRDGFVELDINEDSVQTRSRPTDNGSIRQVSFQRCVERLGGHVDILKLDCEGAEWTIFDDVKTWGRVRYVAMEYHLVSEHTTGDVLFSLQNLGFRILRFTSNSSNTSGFGLVWAVRQAPLGKNA